MNSFVVEKSCSFELAYARAVASEREREPQTGIGYRIYAMTSTSLVCLDITSELTSYAVLGSQPGCDVVIPKQPGVADRHALVRCDVLDDGCPLLVVLDLDSPDGFHLPDRTRPRAIASVDVVAFRIGGATFVALPSGKRLPPSLPELRCAHTAQPERRVAARRPSAAPLEVVRRISDVLVFRGPVSIGVLDAPHRVHEAPAGAVWELAVETEQERAAFDIVDRDLDVGVLVGRNPRCLGNGLVRLLPLRVSRVHLLFLRARDGKVLAFDLASMNGVWLADGTRVRAAAIKTSMRFLLTTSPRVTVLFGPR